MNMGFTNFPHGITSFGIPVLGGALPVGTGKIRHLVAAKASTDVYYSLLQQWNVDEADIYSSLTTAYGDMTTNQGDTLLVYPGNHVQTASLTWDKDNTRIIGLGTWNQRQQPSTLTTGAARLTCTTAAIAQILYITGDYVSMYNIGTMNSAADTGNLYDVLIASRNFYAENCSFRGGNTSTQNTAATAGIPLGIGAGYAARFVNCQIGQSGNATRTTGPGFVKFITGGHGGIDFINCDFQMRSETTGANPSGFLVQQTSLDRLTRFIACSFYNFSENWGDLPDYLFNIDQTTTFDILLMGGCGMIGFDVVSDNAHVKTSQPIPHTNGVEALAVATS
jgi:hypothetical protein